MTLAIIKLGAREYNGENTIRVEMKAAPENTYVYKFNENLQSYQWVQSEDFEEINFDTYFLGLVGACNPYAKFRE